MINNRSIRYAAYGSNLHPLRLMERIRSARLLGSGFIAGHGLHFNKKSVDKSGKCSIAEAGPGVYVAVYEMSADDKSTLDGIEGVGCGYSDEVIDVPGFSACATYIVEDSYLDNIQMPYDWYRELVLLGCRHQRFPEEYVDRIIAIETKADPDSARNAKNWQLIERIRQSQ